MLSRLGALVVEEAMAEGAAVAAAMAATVAAAMAELARRSADRGRAAQTARHQSTPPRRIHPPRRLPTRLCSYRHLGTRRPPTAANCSRTSPLVALVAVEMMAAPAAVAAPRVAREAAVMLGLA